MREGPTSARLVIVDYDATSNTLTALAVWHETEKQNTSAKRIRDLPVTIDELMRG